LLHSSVQEHGLSIQHMLSKKPFLIVIDWQFFFIKTH
jgi:hypothetical protein